MDRILVIGCPGSGKTRLAGQLSEKLGLPVVHLDRLWWTGDWENVSREEFDRRLEEVLEGEQWIIDGNFSRTMPMRLQYCDTIIYLDYSRWQCLAGMAQRVIANQSADWCGDPPRRRRLPRQCEHWLAMTQLIGNCVVFRNFLNTTNIKY